MVFLFAVLELPEEVRERWETFCTSSLGETNKRNTVDLVSSDGEGMIIAAALLGQFLFVSSTVSLPKSSVLVRSPSGC